jgi:lipoprotein-anchoring transpeptidase ErfK/SrfK
MRKKNVIYLLIIFLLLICSSLYNKYMSKSTALPPSMKIFKMDLIAFPIKENDYKISPLIKQPTNSIPKNKVDENKGKSTEVKIIEKTPEIKKPLPEKITQVSTTDTVLKLGDSGDRVKYIQHRLNEYGYKIEEDGLFKALTYDAILNFQYRCRLGIDGSVGPKTLEKLNIAPDKNVEFNTKITSVSNSKNTTSTIALNNYKSISDLESSINSLKATSDTNYYINVDLSNQRVNIFTKSDGKWILDRSFICSTGKASTPTVKGDFTIKDKGPMFRAGSNTICNYYTRFYGNYLFHTVLLDNNENIQDGRLGTPLSHGCIRLAIDDAKYIYTSIPYGTNVSIH